LLPDGGFTYCDGSGSCTVSERTIGGFENLWSRIFHLHSALRQNLGGPADLVPLPLPASSAPYGFCRRNDQGVLILHVFNQGSTFAAASRTRVIFENNAPVDVDTPGLAPGTGAEVGVSVPASCFDATNNCRFVIGVDANRAVTEIDETNNNAAGACGPQLL
jgi:subtilase family serine protease